VLPFSSYLKDRLPFEVMPVDKDGKKVLINNYFISYLTYCCASLELQPDFQVSLICTSSCATVHALVAYEGGVKRSTPLALSGVISDMSFSS
jgi:hypothetical protein